MPTAATGRVPRPGTRPPSGTSPRCLEDAGYTVTEQEFDYEFYDYGSPAVLDPVSPDLPAYQPLVDVDNMQYSGRVT